MSRTARGPLLAAGLLGALLAPARADACATDSDCGAGFACLNQSCFAQTPPNLSDWAVISGGVGAGLADIGILIALFTAPKWSGPDAEPGNTRSAEVLLYGGGGTSALLGVAGIVLQAASGTVGCPVKSECAVAYGLSAGAVGGGALMILGAVYATKLRAGTIRRAWLTPVPMVLPSVRGHGVGVGLAGVNF